MKLLPIIFLFLVLHGCKTDPKPQPQGVDYSPKKVKVEKPNIKPEDAAKFKRIKRVSDSVIYSRLMDFKKENKTSKIQSLKLTKKSPTVKLEDLEKNYQKFIKNVKLSDKTTENPTPKEQPEVKLKIPDKQTKNNLKKPEPDGVKEMASDFEKALIAVARDQKNDFKNIMASKLGDKSQYGDISYRSTVQFPAAQSTTVRDESLKKYNYVSVKYMVTNNLKEAQEMFESLSQLYYLTGLDGHAYAKENIDTELYDTTLLVPLVEPSSRYANLVIVIDLFPFPAFDATTQESYIKYTVAVNFQTLK